MTIFRKVERRGVQFRIAKLTFKLGPVQLTSDDHKVIAEALARAKD